MRIGVRLALSVFAIGAVAISAGAVHLLWSRTAETNSRALVDTINGQIGTAVEKEIEQIARQARAAHGAIRTLFYQNVLDSREADKREFVFLSQLQAQSSISWIVFGWPNGDFFGAHKRGDGEIEMMEIAEMEGTRRRRMDRYDVAADDIYFKERRFEPSHFMSTDQPWYDAGLASDRPRWIAVTDHPNGRHPALVYTGPVDVYSKRIGVLAVVIHYERLSRFLASLAVGRTGAVFILDGDAAAIAVPDPEADETRPADMSGQPLLPIAQAALTREAGRMAETQSATIREVSDERVYNVTLTPLGFSDWALATVLPEEEFLGPIQRTTRRLAFGLAAGLVLLAAASAVLARRLLAEPLAAVAGELAHVERFELGRVRRHNSQLTEIDTLSEAIVRMSSGLAAFGKYLPSDIVRSLVSEGVQPRPGGSYREITVLFADIAGFTGISERMGDSIVPLVSAYLDLVSRQIGAHGGTIDKFIGDAVMAFWGAPSSHPQHASAACHAALACAAALRQSPVLDDSGHPIEVRIGLNSGRALVGNIGSENRLNYTAIGDTVNIASRLEAANKLYGTTILIGEETRRQAGDDIVVREIGRFAVRGRFESITIFELLGSSRTE